MTKNGDAEGTGDLAGIEGGGEMAGAVPMVASEKDDDDDDDDDEKCKGCSGEMKGYHGGGYCSGCLGKGEIEPNLGKAYHSSYMMHGTAKPKETTEKPPEQVKKNDSAEPTASCKECSDKAHKILKPLRARALSGDEGDWEAVRQRLAPHVGGTGNAEKIMARHDGKALDDERDYKGFHHQLTNTLHAKHILGKAELNAKAKEPIKPAAGNGVKIKALSKGDFGPTGKAAAMAPVGGTGAQPPKLPGKGRTFGMADLGAAKQKMVGAGIKPASPLGMPGASAAPKLPGAGAAPPKPGQAPAGVAHLQAPAAPVMPAAKPPAPPAPTAMGGGAPKAPGAAPKLPGAGMKSAAPSALPKPSAAPQAPKQSKPDAAVKSQKEQNNLKKNGK